MLAVLGLAYACLWWSFQRFYAQFGVSPQDVGLTPSGSASDIAGAALELGVWLLVVVAVLTVLPVAAVTALAMAWGRARREVAIAVMAAGVLLGLTAFLYWQLVDHPVGLILLAIAAALFLLLRVLVPLLKRLHARPIRRRPTPLRTRSLPGPTGRLCVSRSSWLLPLPSSE